MQKSNEIIWPTSLRIIHWLVALFVLLDAFIVEDALHRYIGYAALLLVLLRGVRGIWGRGHERFSAMPLSFKSVCHFCGNHFQRKAHYEGHNPMASLVYILMWVLILALGVTGWMLGLDAYWGDEDLSILHEQFSDALIVLVVIHLVGLIVDAVLYKRKTWMGMIDGKAK